MAEDTLNDRIAAARMRVDQEFEDRVQASSFSRQQWGLVMTAIEFNIEEADDPEGARLVADTSKLSSVMSQVEDAGNRGPAMGGGGGRGGGSGGSSGSSGGFFSAVTDALGLGGDSGKSGLQREAEQLAQEYAEELQAQLENRGRWEQIRSEAGD